MDTTPETTGEHTNDETEPTPQVTPVSVIVFNRPWCPSAFTEEEYDDLLRACAREAADRLDERLGRDGYPRNSFAAALMDPTASPYDSDDESLLAVVIIGHEGERFVPNAIAKAYDGRRLHFLTGEGNVGIAVHTASYLLREGAFRYGHGSKDFGGSGLSESMDLREAARLYRAVIDGVVKKRQEWEDATGPGQWFNDSNTPDDRYELPHWRSLRTFDA